MKFGKTLRQKVNEDWIASAVDYAGMKKALPKADEITLSSHRSEEDYVGFWERYHQSLSAVQSFHVDKVEWATQQLNNIKQLTDKKRMASLPGAPKLSLTISLDDLLSASDNYIQEMDLILEFLELNFLAFSKILKKFDKRTILKVRQVKLDEIMQTHPFFNRRDMLQLKAEGVRMHETLHRLLLLKASREKGPKIVQVSGEEKKKAKEMFMLRKAKIILDEVGNSPFFKNNPMRQNPEFQESEVELGAYLGEGEFSIVREIKAFHVNESCPICMLQTLQKGKSMPTSDSVIEANSQKDKDFSSVVESTPTGECIPVLEGKNGYRLSISNVSGVDVREFDNDHEDHNTELVSHRGFLKHHCTRNGIARYAIKELKKKLDNRKKFDGAVDIAIEAKFLSSLSHSNIIKICGTGGIPGHSGFFIVLDRLYDTLGDKMNAWAKTKKEFSGGLIAKKSKTELSILWVERLVALYDIARAMKYLHSQEVIYRDLKPENIGFDVRGNAKIFDFGLAKELQAKDKIAKDQYRASGRTGTRRYMAPEVTLCKPYGKPADVYSFAILSWGTLALEIPFDGYSYEKHAKHVVQGGKRPLIPNKWPTMIKEFLIGGWHSNPSARNNFDQMCGLLGGELENESFSVMDRSNRLMDTSFSGFSMGRNVLTDDGT